MPTLTFVSRSREGEYPDNWAESIREYLESLLPPDAERNGTFVSTRRGEVRPYRTRIVEIRGQLAAIMNHYAEIESTLEQHGFRPTVLQAIKNLSTPILQRLRDVFRSEESGGEGIV